MPKKAEEWKDFSILAINPGSTSTKIGLFENDEQIWEEVVRHPYEEIAACRSMPEQKVMRRAHIERIFRERGEDLASLDAIVGRGGIVQPIDSGTYTINERMYEDLVGSAASLHASALGGLIAREMAASLGIPCYVVDPVVVDELDQSARLAGLPGVERRCVFHALNQKAVARRCAESMGMKYEDARFIVAHMGGGISVGAHRYGRVIDVNDALIGEGPFTPERTGSLPANAIIDLCFSGEYTKEEMITKLSKQGGMQAYLGTNDMRVCERMIKEGDEFAALVLESMGYQVSKEICSLLAVLEGRVDAIILTGGLAYSTRFTASIKQRVATIAPVKVYPGEDELKALAEGALRVLRGQEKALEYNV